MEKKKILFICLGNICRSPMAEFVMKKIVGDAGVSEHYEIASAATSYEEVGNPVYPPAKRKLAENGITCTGKTARRMTPADYHHYDYIIAMDRNNVRQIISIIGEDSDNKVTLLMDYTDNPHDVADPWYTGNFDATWTDVTKGCTALFKLLERK